MQLPHFSILDFQLSQATVLRSQTRWVLALQTHPVCLRASTTEKTSTRVCQRKKKRKWSDLTFIGGYFLSVRYNPNDDHGAPKFVSYYLNMKECGPMFLDALIKIKDEIDPTLSFRRSCREGICGSCAMNIDGRHHLACICRIPKNNDNSQISPLMFMFVLKDLVVDMTNFYNQYKSIDPYLKRKTPKQPGQKEYYQSQEDRDKIDGLYECVLCGSCQATCPSYWWHSEDYLGPAVLMQAYRWIIDSRDEYTDERLHKIGRWVHKAHRGWYEARRVLLDRSVFFDLSERTGPARCS